MIVLRNGMHIPKPEWKKWRDGVVIQIEKQWKLPMFVCPMVLEVNYRAGDKRRRDVTAVLDSIFHCLEKARIISDDSLIHDVKFATFYDKQNPGAELHLFPKMI